MLEGDATATKSGYRGESKADTGTSPKRMQEQQKADTGATHPQYIDCSDVDRSPPIDARAREVWEIPMPQETEHGPQCVCEKCFEKNIRRLKVNLDPPKTVEEIHQHPLYRA